MPVPPISPLPPAPQITDAPGTFNEKANDFVAALSTLVTETNATVDEINDAIAGALVQFDGYKGNWEAGTYDKGDVVRNNERFFISLVDSNTQEPPNTNWQELLTAAATSYDNTTSGLAATDVQEAIDQIVPSDGIVSSDRISGSYKDVKEIAGLISAAIDTSIVSTTDLRAVLSSENSRAQATRSAVIASLETRVDGINSCAIASVGTDAVSRISGSLSAIMATSRCLATGTRNAIIAGDDNLATGSRDAVIASVESRTNQVRCVTIASRGVLNNESRTLALGDGSDGPLTSNRKIVLNSLTGNIDISGSLSSGQSFSDFAEMMQNGTGAEILPGTILTLDSGKVRPANNGEDICGVVSHTAAVLAGDTPFCWQGRYLCDEFGRRLFETVPDPDWEPSEGQTEADRPDIKVLKENPEWNPSLPQVPRSERPDEWTPVGIIGQVYVRTGEAVQSGDKLKPVEGVGFKSTERTGLRVMTVTKEHDGDYGIAKCLINVMA